MPYETETDRELVARFLGGDNAAFDALHRRYYVRVYRLAYMQTNNREDAEDIASETFCRAFRHMRQFRFETDTLYPWLYKIAVNLCIDLCRDKSSRQMVSLSADAVSGIQTFLERIEDTKPSPLELLQQKEVKDLVRSAIAALTPDQREAVVHRFLGELSLKETADAMHKSEGAVKSLIHRGLESLRDEILSRVSEAERMYLLRKGENNVRRDAGKIHRRIDGTG